MNYETIHNAVNAGDLADVKRHLKRGADVNAKDEHGRMPLNWAMIMGQIDIDMLKFLVAKGADVDPKNGYGKTPLMIFVALDNLDMVKFLVAKGADVNARDEDGSMPLCPAALNGNLDMVKFLVEKGANINRRMSGGNTPLDWAMIKGQIDIDMFKTLVDKGGRPLEETMFIKSLDVVKFLVDKGADMNTKSKGDMLPLMAAAEKGKRNVDKLVKERNAKLLRSTLVIITIVILGVLLWKIF